MPRPKQLELEGFREAVEDAVAKLNEAQAQLDKAAIPERDRTDLRQWTMQLQYGCAGAANRAAAIGLDLRAA